MQTSKLRAAVSFSTWFNLGPDYGMLDYEILARGSAILMKPENSNVFNKIMSPTKAKKFVAVDILACAHVVHPFDFPHYYPHDFLKFIKPNNIRCAIDIRDNISGNILVSGNQLSSDESEESKSKLYFYNLKDKETKKNFHPVRDICCLSTFVPKSLIDDHGLVIFDRPNIKMENIKTSYNVLRSDEELFFLGHSVVAEQDKDTGQVLSEKVLPESIRGSYLASVEVRESRNPSELIKRNFAVTDRVCEMGMCGGPVVRIENENLRLMGMVEGIVKTGIADHPLENHVSFISSSQVMKWLEK